jgi:protein O-mannosyl-transferase
MHKVFLIYLKRRPHLVGCVTMLCAIALAWLVYSPGLSGGYLFDDSANLDALGSTGPIDTWASFLRYITSGVADPTGRPLTLLSFLIDAQNWPADPYSFKQTNVLLHLLNGVLLWRGTLALSSRLRVSLIDRYTAAILSSGFWLLHPLFVSTTLYIVQREAMLPLTFVLLGLLAWCKGRRYLERESSISGWLWMIVGAWVCTGLAVLCKANGALLPALLAIVEATVLYEPNPSRRLRNARRVLLGVPIVLLIVGLTAQIPFDIRVATENRPWSIWQRLITEPRVVCDYLRLLWLPRSTSFGVFNDQFQASTNLLEPWTTLPCILFIGLLSLAGWKLRKPFRVLALAILFFLIGLSMESTFVPLELAFEHRTYLPSIFMFWPLALWLTTQRAIVAKKTFAIFLLAVLSVLTLIRAQVWGNEREQALIWGNINPDSPRAQAFAASTELALGSDFQALARLRHVAEKMPNELQITLNLEQTECAIGQITPKTWNSVLASLEHTTGDGHRSFDWFVASISEAKERKCGGLTWDKLEDALQAARMNPKYGRQPGRISDSFHIEGLIALAQGQADRALDKFNSAIVNAPDRGTALSQAAELGSAGFPELGLSHLAFADALSDKKVTPLGMPRIHAWILERQLFWENETEHLKETLAADIKAENSQSMHIFD